jgi:hypothetical protein
MSDQDWEDDWELVEETALEIANQVGLSMKRMMTTKLPDYIYIATYKRVIEAIPEATVRHCCPKQVN